MCLYGLRLTAANCLAALQCQYVGASLSQLPLLSHLYGRLYLFLVLLYDSLLSNMQLGRSVSGLQTKHWQECNNHVLRWCQIFFLWSLCGVKEEFVLLSHFTWFYPEEYIILSVPVHCCQSFLLPLPLQSFYLSQNGFIYPFIASFKNVLSVCFLLLFFQC